MKNKILVTRPFAAISGRQYCLLVRKWVIILNSIYITKWFRPIENIVVFLKISSLQIFFLAVYKYSPKNVDSDF